MVNQELQNIEFKKKPPHLPIIFKLWFKDFIQTVYYHLQDETFNTS